MFKKSSLCFKHLTFYSMLKTLWLKQSIKAIIIANRIDINQADQKSLEIWIISVDHS